MLKISTLGQKRQRPGGRYIKMNINNLTAGWIQYLVAEMTLYSYISFPLQTLSDRYNGD